MERVRCMWGRRPETDGEYEQVFSCLLMTLSLWLQTEESLWNHHSHQIISFGSTVTIRGERWPRALRRRRVCGGSVWPESRTVYGFFEMNQTPLVMKWFTFAASVKSCVSVLQMNKFIQLRTCCILLLFSVWSSVAAWTSVCQISLALQHVSKWLQPSFGIISIPCSNRWIWFLSLCWIFKLFLFLVYRFYFLIHLKWHRRRSSSKCESQYKLLSLL